MPTTPNILPKSSISRSISLIISMKSEPDTDRFLTEKAESESEKRERESVRESEKAAACWRLSTCFFLPLALQGKGYDG